MNRDHMRMNSGGTGEGAGALGDSGAGAGQPAGHGPHEQLELLISRIADGEGAPSDWQAFDTLAQRVPGAWQELACAQRAHAAMSVAVGVALHAADRVSLPGRAMARAYAGIAEADAPERIVLWSRVRSWGGWAAAAAVGLAWMTGGFKGLPVHNSTARGPATVPVQSAGFQINSPEDAINIYKDMGKEKGSFLGEVPQRIKISSVPTADGRGWEVTYLRQFIEKVTVMDLVEFPSADESGKPEPRRVSPPMVPGAAQ